jgi:hypothetical protein
MPVVKISRPVNNNKKVGRICIYSLKILIEDAK